MENLREIKNIIYPTVEDFKKIMYITDEIIYPTTVPIEYLENVDNENILIMATNNEEVSSTTENLQLTTQNNEEENLQDIKETCEKDILPITENLQLTTQNNEEENLQDIKETGEKDILPITENLQDINKTGEKDILPITENINNGEFKNTEHLHIDCQNTFNCVLETTTHEQAENDTVKNQSIHENTLDTTHTNTLKEPEITEHINNEAFYTINITALTQKRFQTNSKCQCLAGISQLSKKYVRVKCAYHKYGILNINELNEIIADLHEDLEFFKDKYERHGNIRSYEKKLNILKKKITIANNADKFRDGYYNAWKDFDYVAKATYARHKYKNAEGSIIDLKQKHNEKEFISILNEKMKIICSTYIKCDSIMCDKCKLVDDKLLRKLLKIMHNKEFKYKRGYISKLVNISMSFKESELLIKRFGKK